MCKVTENPFYIWFGRLYSTCIENNSDEKHL